MYDVHLKKKVVKQLKKLPIHIQEKFDDLVADSEESGPIQAEWQNYSKLSDKEYHCHLAYSWVADWRHEKETIIIEVYYAGSREKAPYSS